MNDFVSFLSFIHFRDSCRYIKKKLDVKKKKKKQKISQIGEYVEKKTKFRKQIRMIIIIIIMIIKVVVIKSGLFPWVGFFFVYNLRMVRR